MTEENVFAIWLTGLPASGKTTIAIKLVNLLKAQDIKIQILDSDELREVLTPQPDYSEGERNWFYNTMVYIGRLLTQNCVNVVFAATAHKQSYREKARQSIEKFMEVYVRCSLETCMFRDEKGIYQKALSGQATTVPGLQVPYEPPEEPELMVDTEQQTPEDCAREIMFQLEELSFLRKC